MVFALYKMLENVSCEHDRLNGWNSTLQAAWYIRHVRWTCLFYISFTIWFCEQKPIINTQFHQKKSFARVLHFINLLKIGVGLYAYVNMPNGGRVSRENHHLNLRQIWTIITAVVGLKCCDWRRSYIPDSGSHLRLVLFLRCWYYMCTIVYSIPLV